MPKPPRLWPLLILCGCNPGSPQTGASFELGDLAAPIDAAPPDLVPSQSGVRALIRDEGGMPLASVSVAACNVKTCEYAKSESDGTVFIPTPDEAIDMVVKTLEDDTTSPPRGESMAPLHFPGRVTADVGTLYVPSLPDGAKLAPPAADPQTVTAGDGLVLTLRRADLEPPLGAIGNQVAARLIPPAHVPPLPGIDPQKLVAVYALSPFAMKSQSKIALRLPSSLPPGTAVSVRTLSDLDGTPSPAQPGHSDGSFITTDPAAGIVELTWLIVSR